MVPCEFHRAQNDKGAIEAAAGGARFLAGGTTLVDLMREHIERPAALVDINRLPHRRIEITARGLEIGALARMADVAADRRVAVAYPVLVESLLASASPQIRNMASIGGNLLQRTRCTCFRDPGVACNKKQPGSGCPARIGVHRTYAIFGASEACIATHASDLAVALVALDAILRVRGSAGERSVPLAKLYRTPGTTPHLEHTLRADELMVRIDTPAGEYTSASPSSPISGCSDRPVAGGQNMNPVVTPYQVQTVEAALTAAEAPPRLRTTLYDVMAALQTVVEPDEDDLVVAVMVYWLRSRRITFVRDVT